MAFMTTITAHLLTTCSSSALYSRATIEHPFLRAAADGTLTDNLLSLWLFQDRIYAAQAYPRFIGSLISHIQFRHSSPRLSTCPDYSQRILKLLVFSLQNVSREVEFFDNTSKVWGLNLSGWKERKETRDYTAEMARVSTSGRTEEGLLFLWAMEKMYLDAWTNVKGGLSTAASARALSEFSTNWSTPEFEAFVDELACLVDDIYKDLSHEAWVAAEDIWKRVIELEAAFWPTVEDVSQCVLDIN